MLTSKDGIDAQIAQLLVEFGYVPSALSLPGGQVVIRTERWGIHQEDLHDCVHRLKVAFADSPGEISQWLSSFQPVRLMLYMRGNGISIVRFKAMARGQERLRQLRLEQWAHHFCCSKCEWEWCETSCCTTEEERLERGKHLFRDVVDTASRGFLGRKKLKREYACACNACLPIFLNDGWSVRSY